MDKSTSLPVNRLLRLLEIQSHSYLRDILLSRPDSPLLAAIAGVLNGLNK